MKITFRISCLSDYLLSWLLLMLLSGFVLSGLSAQSIVYFTEIPSNELTIEQADFLQDQIASSYFLDGGVVYTSTALSVLSDGVIEFSIPGSSKSYMVQRVGTSQVESPYYDEKWMGNVIDGGVGNILLLRKGQLLSGFMQIEEGFFSILPVENNTAILLKHNEDAYDHFLCETIEEIAENSSNFTVDPCLNPPSTCQALVDVLVLVSDESRAWLNALPGATGNPFIPILYTLIGLESINLALVNSDVDNKQFRFTLERFDFDFDPFLDFEEDLRQLTDSDDAQKRRDANGADIVILLTNQTYGTVAGVAWGGPNEARAYGLVEIPFMINPRWTFAHEVGHIVGMNHNRIANGGDQDNDNELCSHGWRYTGGVLGLKRSIMALSLTPAIPPGTGVFNFVPGGRLLNYSNPNVIVDVGATGTNADDNARTVANTACQVALFRADPNLRIQLVVPDEVCMQDVLMASVVIFEPNSEYPGQPPYTISWNVTPSTAQTVFIPIQVSFPQVLNVTVTVTASDGVSLSRTESVDIVNCEGFPFAPLREVSDHTSSGNKSEGGNLPISIYPIPASNLLNISIPSDLEYNSLTVIDVNGRILQLDFQRTISGISYNLEGIPSGLYYIRCSSKENAVIHSFIKL